MDIIQQPGGCLQLRHNQDELSKPYLLISDVHFDSPKCNRKLLKQHLDEAVAKGAGIMCFGDWFDSMQSRNDRRGNKSDLRAENKVANYVDSLVDSTVDFLKPYKQNLVLFSSGNHESSFVQKLETDLIYRVVQQLDSPNFYQGGYQGFIRFHHLVSSTSTRSTTLYYHHGNWLGNISKGMLATIRYASIVPDANIVVSGHTHDRWCTEHNQLRLTQNGTIKNVSQLHIKVGCYKDESTEINGWHTEKVTFAKSLGGFWLTFQREGDDVVPKAMMT